MTVCIAVTPPASSEIILVSDRLLSSDETSVEGGWKVTKLAARVEWYMMFAGDASRIPPFTERMREPLGGIRDTRLTLETVIEFVERAYAIELQKLVETEILSPFGLARDEFIKKGRRWLGESRYSQLFDQINSIDLGLEILVVGLDAWFQTQMFSISPRGTITRAVLPYHAIGSGAYVALGALYQLAYFPGPDFYENVYRTCAAKFAAESAPGVGRETHALVVDPLKETWRLLMWVDELRELWRIKGQPVFPKAAERLLRRELKPFKTYYPKIDIGVTQETPEQESG